MGIQETGYAFVDLVVGAQARLEERVAKIDQSGSRGASSRLNELDARMIESVASMDRAFTRIQKLERDNNGPSLEAMREDIDAATVHIQLLDEREADVTKVLRASIESLGERVRSLEESRICDRSELAKEERAVRVQERERLAKILEDDFSVAFARDGVIDWLRKGGKPGLY